jgi:hypothetical protein
MFFCFSLIIQNGSQQLTFVAGMVDTVLTLLGSLGIDATVQQNLKLWD